MRTFKLVFGGEGGVGKTSLIRSLLDLNLDNEMTIGVDFNTLDCSNLGFKVQIWDLAGEDRFKYLHDSFVKNTDLFVFVFDFTRINYTLFRCFSDWKDIFLNCDDETVLLVGNKSDLSDGCIDFDEVEVGRYIKTSAITKDGIIELKNKIIDHFRRKN